MKIIRTRAWRALAVPLLLLVGAVNPVASIAAGSAQGAAYIPNLLDSSVSVVDLASGSVVGSIPVSFPYGTAVSPDGSRVVVTSLFGGGDGGGDSVSIIDTATRTVIRTITLGANSTVQPNGVAIDTKRNKLYVAFSLRDSLGIVDLDTGAITEVSVGDNPVGVTIGWPARSVYVTNYGSGTVSVVDPVQALNVGTITVGANPAGIEADEQRRRVFVADSGSGTVSVIDGMRGNLVTTVTLPSGAVPEDVSVRAGAVAVSNVGTGGIALIHPSTLAVTRVLAVDGSWGIDTAKDGRLVITFAGFGSAGIVKASGPLRVTTVPTGAVPLGLGRFIAR